MNLSVEQKLTARREAAAMTLEQLHAEDYGILQHWAKAFSIRPMPKLKPKLAEAVWATAEPLRKARELAAQDFTEKLNSRDIGHQFLDELFAEQPRSESEQAAKRVWAWLQASGLADNSLRNNTALAKKYVGAPKFGDWGKAVASHLGTLSKHLHIAERERNEERIADNLAEPGQFEPGLVLGWAEAVLRDPRAPWEALSMAIALASGRRQSEVHGEGSWQKLSERSILFDGQAKLKGRDPFSYEIPTLLDADLVLAGRQRLIQLGKAPRSPVQVNQSIARMMSTWLKAHTIPGTERLESLTYKGSRDIYESIAKRLLKPAGISDIEFVAQILGHAKLYSPSSMNYAKLVPTNLPEPALVSPHPENLADFIHHSAPGAAEPRPTPKPTSAEPETGGPTAKPRRNRRLATTPTSSPVAKLANQRRQAASAESLPQPFWTGKFLILPFEQGLLSLHALNAHTDPRGIRLHQVGERLVASASTGTLSLGPAKGGKPGEYDSTILGPLYLSQLQADSLPKPLKAALPSSTP